MTKQEQLNAITVAEDACREIRNCARRPTSAYESLLRDLADAVAQGFQAIRESMQ